MLRERIISALSFFDLQDYPLTLLELREFLLADLQNLSLDEQGEINNEVSGPAAKVVSADEILHCLESDCASQVGNYLGFYHLVGRKHIAENRLQNYFFGIGREKLIRKYIGGLRYLPFVRGVALAGSQAMGQQKANSDIDLLIITDPKFMWLARTAVTGYFQVFGQRRHGQNIANRFCLNHYLAGPKPIRQLKNLYTAVEYLKLRPLVYGRVVREFQDNNHWIKSFLPNGGFLYAEADRQTAVQKKLEEFFGGKFGPWLEQKLKNWQLPKIRREKFIVVEEDELSFHPSSKQQSLLSDFLKFQQQ